MALGYVVLRNRETRGYGLMLSLPRCMVFLAVHFKRSWQWGRSAVAGYAFWLGPVVVGGYRQYEGGK